MGPVVTAGALLLCTARLGAVALTAAAGSRLCRGSAWALTASSVLVAGVIVAIRVGVARCRAEMHNSVSSSPQQPA